MDRGTVRLILFVLGILTLAGIYVWGRYRERLMDFFRRGGEYDQLAFDDALTGDDASGDEPEFPAHDRGAALRFGSGTPDDDGEFGASDERAPSMTSVGDMPREASVGAPFLIQVSVVARSGDIFSGEELRDALLDLGLVHGEMEIFHRYDRSLREPLFSVASLVKPGTFPIEDMETFECPGVVLFFQPGKVSEPLAVFDDLFETSRDLAEKLDGIEWDDGRRPLTEAKIREMRERLEDVCG
jgi:cell division protein ZipA